MRPRSACSSAGEHAAAVDEDRIARADTRGAYTGVRAMPRCVIDLGVASANGCDPESEVSEWRDRM